VSINGLPMQNISRIVEFDDAAIILYIPSQRRRVSGEDHGATVQFPRFVAVTSQVQ